MLNVFFGTDTIAVRAAAFSLLGEAEAEGARTSRIDSDTYEPGQLSDALGAASLFGGEECYLIDSPKSEAALAAEVHDSLAELGESANTFIIIEGALTAAERKAYEAHASRVEERKAVAGERFNPFSLADALARRDKRSLWVLLQEARRAGLVPEEIIGTLWWQLKTLRLATVAKNAEEAGIKEYPFKKATAALKHWPEPLLRKRSLGLLTIYHEGHAGLRELDLALEEWVLTV